MLFAKHFLSSLVSRMKITQTSLAIQALSHCYLLFTIVVYTVLKSTVAGLILVPKKVADNDVSFLEFFARKQYL